jgi:hypothetical protein
MFEVWEITSGNGAGELLVAAVEANRFRQDVAARHQMDV